MPHWNSPRDSFELRCPTAKLRQPRTRPKEPHMGPGGPRKRLQDGVGRVSRRLQEGSGATCRANGGRHLDPRGRQDGPKRASRRPEKRFPESPKRPMAPVPVYVPRLSPFCEASAWAAPPPIKRSEENRLAWIERSAEDRLVFCPPVRLLKIRSGPFWAVE